MSPYLFLIPVVSALIGWCLSKLGSYILVNQYLPKQKHKIAAAIAEKANALLPFSRIEKQVADPALIEKAMPSIEAHIDEFLSVKLPQEIPMLAMFVGNKTTDKIKEVFVNQLRELFPKVMTDIVGNLKGSFDIESLVHAEMNKINWSTLAGNQLSGPLQRMHIFGLLTGLVIGLINLGIFCLLAS